jgi:hypothetical protein
MIARDPTRRLEDARNLASNARSSCSCGADFFGDSELFVVPCGNFGGETGSLNQLHQSP